MAFWRAIESGSTAQAARALEANRYPLRAEACRRTVLFSTGGRLGDKSVLQQGSWVAPI